MIKPELCNILLTDAATLKDLGFISEGLDEKLIPTSIRYVQDNNIEGCLGSTLYNAILAEVNSGEISSRFTILLDNYILYALGYFVQADLTIPLSNKLRNAGSINTNDNNVQNVQDGNMKNTVQFLNNKGEFYLDYMLRYIRQNIQYYPEYYNTDPNDKQSSDNAFKCNIYLGNSNFQSLYRLPENQNLKK